MAKLAGDTSTSGGSCGRGANRRRRVSLTTGVFAVLVALGSCGGSTKAPEKGADTTSTTSATLSAPTRTEYQVDGRSVALECRGKGPVPVVFLAGGRARASTWDKVLSSLGPDVLACVFDRPGVGHSEASPEPLSPHTIGTALEGAFAQAGLGPRMVLVGHSLGGTTAVVFGADHPERVAGGVLIDATIPEFLAGPSDVPVLVEFGYDPEKSAAQVRAATRWPAVPLRVLSHDPVKVVATGGLSAEDQVLWTAGQHRFERLSSKASLVVVPDSSHDIQIDAPEVVATAIREVLTSVS